MAVSVRTFAAVGALALLAPVLGVASSEGGAKPCVRTTVAMTSDVDTAHARALDSFAFSTADAAVAPDGTVIPAGTPGYGVVAIATHAQRGGRGGYVVLETRFLQLADAKRIPVTIDWTSAARATATGASQNIPGIVGAVPLVGYVLGPYGFLHHGKDVTIARGTRIPVVVGDDVAAGACSMPSPAPSPSNTAPADASPAGSSPSPAPATSPAPTTSP